MRSLKSEHFYFDIILAGAIMPGIGSINTFLFQFVWFALTPGVKF
jgi:hypothetical protein